MEDSAAKDRSSASGRSASRLLRYPLRSATRPKEEKPPLADSTNSNSAAKRGMGASSVSKSVGVLDLSSKEKPAKPPRRLSVPSKSNNSSAPKTIGNITPISETRAKWPTSGNQGKSDTPLSDVSKSSHRKKFSVLSSSSYWLSQIRLSESAAKHSISLGFFKLALESGCEPMQRVSDALKLYVRRHNLSELSESVKELFDSYKINENFYDQSQQGSETSSQVPIEGNQLSDNDDVKSSSSSITEAEKPKPLDKNIAGKPHAIKSTTETLKKKNNSEKKTRRSAQDNAANSKPSSESRGRSTQRKPRKQSKQDSAQDNKSKDKVKKQGKQPASCDEGSLNSAPNEALEENKENMDDGAPQKMEETNNHVVEIY